MPLPEHGKLLKLINRAKAGYVIRKQVGTQEVWSSQAQRLVTVPRYSEELTRPCWCLSRGVTKRCPTHGRELRAEGLRKGH